MEALWANMFSKLTKSFCLQKHWLASVWNDLPPTHEEFFCFVLFFKQNLNRLKSRYPKKALCASTQSVKCEITSIRSKNTWGAWVAQSVERPTSAQIMISRLVGSSLASGSGLTVPSLEPASDSVSPSLSGPSPTPRPLKNKYTFFKKKKWKTPIRHLVIWGPSISKCLFLTS